MRWSIGIFHFYGLPCSGVTKRRKFNEREVRKGNVSSWINHQFLVSYNISIPFYQHNLRYFHYIVIFWFETFKVSFLYIPDFGIWELGSQRIPFQSHLWSELEGLAWIIPEGENLVSKLANEEIEWRWKAYFSFLRT